MLVITSLFCVTYLLAIVLEHSMLLCNVCTCLVLASSKRILNKRSTAFLQHAILNLWVLMFAVHV